MFFRAVLLVTIVLFAGCKSSPSEDKLLDEVKKAEAALYGDDKNFKFDQKNAENVILAYEGFVKQFPKSKNSPEMLLKAADLHRAMKNYHAALNVYQRIEKEYADFEKLPQVVFLEGFVYENELYKLENARERYEYFLSKFPDHELSDDVKFSLQNLGKSPEEIIKEFEHQTAQPADTASS